MNTLQFSAEMIRFLERKAVASKKPIPSGCIRSLQTMATDPCYLIDTPAAQHGWKTVPGDYHPEL
ncbi:Hypothetical predicted protein [Pelobates cultripes]|uniref:Uncharacterized protein n=1 Tax=Pelobates cultripes TaxID=61616 RepID=A0AAD1WE12_PELCU|nr:Hypothetical predicted protein [Pelobates cultripes]